MAKKRKKHGEDAEFMGYKNKDNRFGDSNLQEQFVWRKKIDKMVATGRDPRELSSEGQRERKRVLRAEVDKLKASREEREREKELMEEERERLSREREAMQYQEWERKEEEFHREQSKRRTEIRIAKGRTRPIDILAKNLLLDEHFDMDMTEPYTVLRGKSAQELQELLEEMKSQATGEHQEYWDALITVCSDELEIQEARHSQRIGVADHGVHKAVHTDLDLLLQGKTSSELRNLYEQVTSTIEAGGDGDVEYWESLMKRLKVHKAKASLRDISQKLLRKHLDKLRSEDQQHKVNKPLLNPGMAPVEEGMAPPTTVPQPSEIEQGSWSPVLISHAPAEDQEFVVTEAQDIEEILAMRHKIHKREAAHVSSDILAAPAHSKIGPTEDELYRAVVDAAEGDTDTTEFQDEVPVEQKTYLWHDKYRPRKPRYFNRVHTGFEWNKYNQTHYDHDNPPPKVVQGYKINVFYPDLIDKTKAPEFFITKDPDGNRELAVLRISAGPPYEDIAFKILNREWEYSHRDGYKCCFERGIFHLCFNFKRHRYRR